MNIQREMVLLCLICHLLQFFMICNLCSSWNFNLFAPWLQCFGCLPSLPSTVLGGHPGSESAREALLLKMSLLNVQSLITKTFILLFFFISRKLDFIFMTETRTTDWDFSPFYPSELHLFNSPGWYTSWYKGGLATVFYFNGQTTHDIDTAHSTSGHLWMPSVTRSKLKHCGNKALL